MSESISHCACKGIRECAVCKPKLVDDHLSSCFDQKPKLKYVFCAKCRTCFPVNDELNDFKNSEPAACSSNESKTCGNKILNGIILIENFITEQEESYLVNEINKSKWVDSQSGRFKQDYGPKVNFKKKKLKPSCFVGLPHYSKFFIDRLFELKNEDKIFDNFIPVELCNLKYESKRGASIDPHFDDVWLWGERLITLNLLSDTFLTMSTNETGYENYEVFVPLKRFSLVIVYGDARYKWMHSIKRNHINNTRIAITLRELSDEFKPAANGSPNADIGKQIESASFTYKGISVAELDEYREKCDQIESVISENTSIVSQEVVISRLCERLKIDYKSLFELDSQMNIEKLNGYSDLTFLLCIGNGKKFILKVFDDNYENSERLNKIGEFQTYLSTKSDAFKVANIISNDLNLGVFCVKISEIKKLYWIQEYIDGSQLSSISINNCFTQQQMTIVGHIVASWRRMSTQYTKENLDQINNIKEKINSNKQHQQTLTNLALIETDYNSFQNLIKTKLNKLVIIDDNRKSKLIAVFNYMHKLIACYDDNYENNNNNNKGIIHCDINPTNIIEITPNNLNEQQHNINLNNYGVIDFLDLNYSFYMYDLAICLWHFMVNYESEFCCSSLDRSRFISTKILSAYCVCYPFSVDDYKFLYWSVLFTMCLSMIEDEEEYYKNQNNDNNANFRIFIDKCWYLFEHLFHNENFFMLEKK